MVQLSNMLFGMTITLANLVLPQVRGTLSATQDEIAWVITLNLVATAVATPMTGWLSSRLRLAQPHVRHGAGLHRLLVPVRPRQ